MIRLFGGGGGLPPGVAGNGAVPGGLSIAGTLALGDQLTPFAMVSVQVPAALAGGAGIDVLAENDTDTAIQAAVSGVGATALLAEAFGVGSAAVRAIGAGATVAALKVEGKVWTDQASAHTLGAYSGAAVPLYDLSGTLLGYVPLYA